MEKFSDFSEFETIQEQYQKPSKSLVELQKIYGGKKIKNTQLMQITDFNQKSHYSQFEIAKASSNFDNAEISNLLKQDEISFKTACKKLLDISSFFHLLLAIFLLVKFKSEIQTTFYVGFNTIVIGMNFLHFKQKHSCDYLNKRRQMLICHIIFMLIGNLANVFLLYSSIYIILEALALVIDSIITKQMIGIIKTFLQQTQKQKTMGNGEEIKENGSLSMAEDFPAYELEQN